MKRENTFKAIVNRFENKGQIVEGYLSKDIGLAGFSCKDVIVVIDDTPTTSSTMRYFVDTDTICQYTNVLLMDDTKEHKIFENDFITINNNGEKIHCIVAYKKGAFVLQNILKGIEIPLYELCNFDNGYWISGKYNYNIVLDDN